MSMSVRSWSAAGVLAMAIAGRAEAGSFSSYTFTGDGDSGISSSKTYTHAVEFVGSAVTINGVLFTSAPPPGSGDTVTGTNFTLNIPKLASVTGNSSGATGNIATLLSDYFTSSETVIPSTMETLTLTGLTPGASYVTTFYNASVGGGARTETVGGSWGGGPFAFDENAAALSALQYSYTTLNGSVQFTFVGPVGIHFLQFGFTNELVPVPETSHVLLAAVAGLAALRFARRRFAAAA